MKIGKAKIGCGLIILLLIVGIFYLWHKITWKGNRDLGDLSNSCNEKYKINITHYSDFDHKQPLYFNIKKNKIKLDGFEGLFEITNNMDESLENFELHCFDNILYVTWRDENKPIIMFDFVSEKLYHLNGKNDTYKKELFDRINKGNSNLEID